MVKVKVAKLENEEVKSKTPKRELYAMIAYYYPQYTLEDAQRLKARDLFLLLKIAQKLKSTEYLNLTQISAAPHTEKGKGVKKIIDQYKKAIND